jgi:predicted amidohydrolase
VLLCFDMEFPEPARALAAAGADLLVTAAANMEPYYADHELASRARALDNRLPHVYVNRVGAQAGLRFVGGSRLIAPDGSVQLQCPEGESLTTATLPPGDQGDEEVQYLAQVPRRLPVRHVHAVPGGSR